MSRASRHYVLAAGGTGGHMIPAYALAEELIRRGHQVALITDERGAKIPGNFDKAQVHILPAGRIAGGPLGWLKAARAILKGRDMAVRLYESFEPSAVIGFGGYPAFPALLAARKRKVPTLIHEQNAVLGRVNRLVASRVNAIATAYPDIQRLPAKCEVKTHLVGNPVRAEVIALRSEPFPAFDQASAFHVLVTGGSQGARIMSDVVPEGLALLSPALRDRLHVIQQCRVEDIKVVRARYKAHGLAAELATYIEDMPAKLAEAHLVISRAGASTIAELTCAGRPAILVPLPSATDDHQTYNVKAMVAAGGGRAIAQPLFTPQELAKQIEQIALEPDALADAAAGARSCGLPDATRDLANLVESGGGAPLMDVIRVGTANPARSNGTFQPAMKETAQ